MSSLPSPWDSDLSRISDAKTLDELMSMEHELFGRKAGKLSVALKALGSETLERKKELGQQLNMVKIALTQAMNDKRRALESASMGALAETDALDVTIDLPKESKGHLHPIHEFIREAQEVFGRMGFDVAAGPELETEDINFNKLNIPADHPARDMQDTFWIKDQAGKVLRTHTSSVQIHYMLSHKPPFRMICTGKVYRKDSDATHSPMFHQIEGLMIGKDISLANMKGVMETAISELISKNLTFRWRTGFFPFVEPGLEMDVKWMGDEKESREGKWLEIVGCGMVHPNVLKNVGIDPDEWQGFAFGFGVERMIMIRHQIPDLRMFFSGELAFMKLW